MQVVLQGIPVAAGLEDVHSRADCANAREEEAVSLPDVRRGSDLREHTGMRIGVSVEMMEDERLGRVSKICLWEIA